jgi:O-antigen/teichoic acid export membrane protein
VLAPFYGIHGAATATAMSFVIGTLFFRRWVHQHFGFRL